MLQSRTFRALLLLLAPLAAACGDDNPPTNPNTPTPVAVTETFSGTLTPNGGLPNDKATLNTTVTGNAQNTGFFCARVYDAAGSLTASTDYTIDVTHF